MKEVTNLTQEDVLALVADFPIVPLRNRVIITTNVEEVDEDGIDLVGNAFSPVQFVLAVGSHAKDFLAPGQMINLDLDAMSVKVPDPENAYATTSKISLKPIELGNKVFGMISADKVEYIIK